ncbi:MAG: uroporphyrinogen-III synthase [Paenirhodobacter sp.]|uniref:uroporphyrinogen-III synthase n=1 Tax=Paenirhodobacter sp. TaxID=1965326 RepID=UPI003D0D42DB
MIRLPEDRPTLLLTRPRAGSERFAQQFRARFGADWPVLVAPLLEIVPTGAALPEAENLIFTSEQAVAPVAAISAPRGRRAYCVGARTGEAACAAGFAVIEGPGDGAALAELIRAAPPGGKLLHARGAEVAFSMAEALNSAGIETIEAVVYRQDPQPPGAELRAALAAEAPLLVPVFSPRSGRLLAEAARGARAPLWLAPLSPAIAQSCATLPIERCEVAPRPDAEALLEALQRLIGAGEAG